ncbi:ABC transporter permease [Solirhodobacter olei]|uniref:ABC transporter permease n=1 Tax=Solirhodobacter olei TaxID=2493082 RepID=UPI0013E2D3A0|nr:ABC transporter permease [Solirhodobacter olei]
MAWRNLWRQPMRTALSLLTMALAAALLVFMLSFQLGVYDTMKSNALRIFDGFARLQPPGYADDPDIRRTITDPEALAAKAEQMKGVTAAAPRATSYVILSNGERSYGAAIVGVSPARERQVSTLASTVHEGRYLKPGDTDVVVLGDALARNLKLKLGDKVTLLGSALDGTIAVDSLRLVGLFHTGIGDLDRQVAEMPLRRFQQGFAMGNTANTIALVGPSLGAVNDALPRLDRLAKANKLTIEDWGGLQPGLKQAITLDFSTSMLWYVSLVVVVVFIILNTLLMSVLERTREFGMLMAIGMRASLVGRMLWLELILLALIGTVAGVVLGGGLALWYGHAGIAVGAFEGLMAQWGLPGRLYPSLSATSALVGPAVIVVSVAVAGLIPMRRIRRLDPVKAMRAA